MQFETIEDAHRYLADSIVRAPIDGEQTYGMVGRVMYRTQNDGSRVPSFEFRKLGTDPETGAQYPMSWYSLDDIEISSQDIMLGNMNHNNQVYYCERMPVRRTQMGLTQSSLQMTNITQEGNIGRVGMFDVLSSDSMKGLLEGSYPTVAETLESRNAIAFSREFAVNPIALTAKHLHYRGGIVGEFSGGRFTIYTPVSYVVDVLNRALEAKGEADYEVSVAV